MSEKPHLGKCLFKHLEQRGLTEYGSVIMAEEVRQVLGIEYPETASKKFYDNLALAELGAVDYCRNILLGEGKYLAGVRDGYRVLLPSENARQVEQYVNSADKKLRRALKLHRNSPKTDAHVSDNVAARLLMKRESIKERGVEASAA